MINLKELYFKHIITNLQKKFQYKNIHQIPKLKKIQINSGLGLNAQNRIFLQKAIEEIRIITGQQPIITKAKNSISSFKIRKDMPLGVTVTLRKEKMYSFLERLIKLVLPRIRDFHGLNPKSFDNQGNFNFGITDQSIFPEINIEDIEQKRGYNITIVTTAINKNESFFLLKELGVPFAKL
jgi:large subunit ribosomal protein L5